LGKGAVDAIELQLIADVLVFEFDVGGTIYGHDGDL
jgi:hypothetical protein